MSAIDEIFGPRKTDKVHFRSVKEDPGFKRFADKRKPKKIAFSIVSKSSEVVVKVSGYTKSGAGATGKGAGPVSGHIRYISRHGETPLETDKGELISGREAVSDFCLDWQEAIDSAKTSKSSANTRDVMHLVLSMPGKQDEEKMRSAIRNFASSTFGGKYEYVFALHTDTENTHGHLAVRCRGFDGKQMQMGRGLVQEWRQYFASELRAQGIKAEATPRALRGVLQKPEPQAFRHMERPTDGRAPRIPEVRKNQIREALGDLQAQAKGQAVTENENATKAKFRVRETKALWTQAAKELEGSNKAEDRALAEKIRGFVADMPALQTQREALRARLLAEGNRVVRQSQQVQADTEKPAQPQPAPRENPPDQER